MDALLVVIPAVTVWKDKNRLVFDQKFYDGLMAYVQGWPGRVRCVIRQSSQLLPAYVNVHVSPDECLPFELLLLQNGEPVQGQHLSGGSVALISGDDFGLLHVAGLCKQADIRCVYLIEYILETRNQIIRIESAGWIRRWRRHLFVWYGERRRLQAFRQADALQINGLPAFLEYGWHPHRLLFFDNRIRLDMMPSRSQLQRRLNGMEAGSPLRLGFSGRLTAIKGADDIIAVADILHRRGLDFSLTIFGGGELESLMKQKIAELGLAENVRMVGTVDFETVLIPAVREQIDIYLLLHRQSDPSCTYLETLACGVPIVGYANKAFEGILDQADAGWQAEISAIDQVADIIITLNQQRHEISKKSRVALDFARKHDFRSTFGKRIDQLKALVSV